MFLKWKIQMARNERNNFFTPLRIILVGIGLLVLAAGVYSRLNPQDRTRETQDSQTSPNVSDGEVPRVQLDDAKEAFDNGTAVFVDTRSYDSFVDGHVPDALLIPLSETETGLTQLDPSSWIIPYCT
jgi:hypothetical protein